MFTQRTTSETPACLVLSCLVISRTAPLFCTMFSCCRVLLHKSIVISCCFPSVSCATRRLVFIVVLANSADGSHACIVCSTSAFATNSVLDLVSYRRLRLTRLVEPMSRKSKYLIVRRGDQKTNGELWSRFKQFFPRFQIARYLVSDSLRYSCAIKKKPRQRTYYIDLFRFL